MNHQDMKDQILYLTNERGTILNTEVDENHHAWYKAVGVESHEAEIYMVRRACDSKEGLMLYYFIQHMGGISQRQYLQRIAEGVSPASMPRGSEFYIGHEEAGQLMLPGYMNGKHPRGQAALHVFIPYPTPHDEVIGAIRMLDSLVYGRIPEYQMRRCRFCPNAGQNRKQCADGQDCRFVRIYQSPMGHIVGIGDGTLPNGYVATCLNAGEMNDEHPYILNLTTMVASASFDEAQEHLNRVARKRKWVLAEPQSWKGRETAHEEHNN